MTRNTIFGFIGLLGSVAPEELFIELSRCAEIPDLLEAGEGPCVEGRRIQADALEHVMQLPRSLSRIPGAAETGQAAMDLREADPVAAVVAAGRAEGKLAARIGLGHDLRDLA